MWIFTRYGFFSVNTAGKGKIALRAREKDHLLDLAAQFDDILGPVEVIVTPQADYRYRIVVPRKTWAALARALAHDVHYGNFKNEVLRRLGPTAYEKALHRIWSILHQIQVDAERARDTDTRLSGKVKGIDEINARLADLFPDATAEWVNSPPQAYGKRVHRSRNPE